MAVTEKSIPSDGSSSYTFEFEYLKPSDIKVSVAGVATTEFTVPPSAPTTIQFNSGHVPANGAGTIRIYRDTTVDNLSATFYAGSAIKSQDLNDNFNQSLFVTQEAKRDIAIAWQDGDDTVHSTETWYTTDDTKIATTKAIQERLNGKQNDNTNLTNLSECQTGASGALAALTQAEIEILDGATVSTDELNYVDGVTSNIQTQLDARQDEDALLTAISGKSFRTSTDGAITTDSDTEIPSSKVVATHVTNSISAIGGFEAITNKNNFPGDEPVAGVIVSIANASDITVNSSGVATITNGAGSNNVIINNFPASLRGGNGENANPFPLPNNTGLLVISTGSSHTYNFHRLLPTTDDVKQLSDDVNDFFARYRIADNAPTSNNQEGDLWWDKDNDKMKVYDSSSGLWIDLVTTGETFISGTNNGISAAGSSVTGGNDTGLFDGTAYRFRLANTGSGLTAGNYLVSLAGTIQRPNAGTSRPSEGFALIDNDIIFANPANPSLDGPATGTSLFITTFGSALTIGAPSNNTVSTVKIQDDAVTADKLDSDSVVTTSIVDDNVTYSKIQNVTTANRVLGSSSADGVVSEVQVTNDMIDDDTISEVKLDIHANPVDGQVLKWGTTNGMEWTEADPEGSNVKSTGETTTDKVLKPDGSGGASWQVDGPVVTATASGDIAAGKPVVLNTDGTVSQIIGATNRSLGTIVEVTDDDYKNPKIIHDTNANKIVVFWADEGNPSSNGDEAIKYKIGTVTGGTTNTISFGSEYTVTSFTDGWSSYDCFDVAYNPNTQRYLLVHNKPGYARFKAGTYDSSGSEPTISWGTEVNISGGTDATEDVIHTDSNIRFKLAAATTSNKSYFCLIYAIAGSHHAYNNLYSLIIDTNSSNNNLSIGDRAYFGPAAAEQGQSNIENEFTGQPADIVWKPTSGSGHYIAAFYQYKYSGTISGQNDKVHLAIISATGGSAPYGASNDYSKSTWSSVSASDNGISLAYNPDEDDLMAFWIDKDDDHVKAKRFTSNGSSISTTSIDNLFESTNSSHADYENAFYNPDTKQFNFIYVKSNDEAQLVTYERSRYGGLTQTQSETIFNYNKYQTAQGLHSSEFENMVYAVYDETTDRLIAISKHTSSSLKARVVKMGIPHNFNNKYLGFTTAQCNDGNTATIAVSGNIVTTTESDLVETATYWVESDGDLRKNANTSYGLDAIEAGFAISPTQLLLK